MCSVIRLLAVTVLVLLPVLPSAAQPAKPAAPTEDEIKQAVKQLADERFTVRQSAMKLLWNAREAAEKHLRDAANSSDPEVSRQARILLDRILYRIEPDTPREIVDLMQRFRSAAGMIAEQSQVIRDMLRLGSKGHKYLLRMLDAVEDKQRRMILDEFAYDDWKVLSSLMAEGQEAVVEQLLDKALAAQNETVVSHYAAFQALTERLDAKIAEFRPRVEKNNQVYDARVLLALYRLKGDQDGALWAARRAQNQFWVRQILMELGRWSELLAEFPPKPGAGLSQVADLGYLAAYQRLAGRDIDLSATLKQIQDYAGEPAAPRNNRPWYAAKVLLINEQPAAALDLLRKHQQHALLAEVLFGQGRFREALEQSEKGALAESGQKYAERSFHVDLLLRAGEKTKAREWLQKLTQDMGESTDPGWLDRQSMFQVRMGDRGEVEKRLLARVEQNDGSSLAAMFAAVFPRLEARAVTLWQMLKQRHSNNTHPQLLARLRQIEEGKMPATELAELLRGNVPVNRNTNQPIFEAVAQLVALLELPDVAEALLKHPVWEKAPTAAQLYLADTLAEAGRWPAAAEAYRKVWEQDKAAPLPLFLHAQALLRINPDDAQAKTLVERSHRLPLGGDSSRYYFHEALSQRGFSADSYREAALCGRLLTNSSWTLGMSHDHLAKFHAARGDNRAAAIIHERNVLRVMPTNSGFRSASAYSRVTADIHIQKARALLSQGRNDEAFREIEKAEQLHPAHLDLAIRIVPALEKAAQKEKADQLFERLSGHWRKVCTDYPESAEARNQLAWLCVRCRRQLNDALTHANKAVELAPNSPSYLDTLAEVLFQRGERQQAIELIKKCLKMPSANVAFYRQQLKRFQMGTPKDDPADE